MLKEYTLKKTLKYNSGLMEIKQTTVEKIK